MDAASVDPHLLQLPELPLSSSKLNPYKTHIDVLFSQWLSLPDTARTVNTLLGQAKAGIPLSSSGGSYNTNLDANNLPLPSMFPSGSAPPLLPRGASNSLLSPRSCMRWPGAVPSSLGPPLKKVTEPAAEVIPQFYFPDGPPLPKELTDQVYNRIEHLFSGHPNGLILSEFVPVTKEVCNLPSFFSRSLFKKIDMGNTGFVTRDQFVHYWIDKNMITMDTARKVFNVLKQPDKNYLTQADFKPILKELLSTHRGLDFLQATLDFQERYVDTVICRIFYYVNRSGNGHITLRELRRSNLLAAMEEVDKEEDINKVLRYFSYEHFFVIYCKFWELDTDHDFLLDKEDLIRYGNISLTYRIVERIFSQAARKFTSTVEGKMGYEDFVCFMLAEEDKSSEPSLEYWFKCIDLDGDGVVTPDEMLYFYAEQMLRMECMGQEPIVFEDILCQMIDMIGPEKEWGLTLRDLKHCKLSRNFFNVLFNLNKFMALEIRDPFLIYQEQEDPTLTEWDRFAHREYIQMSMEEDVEDASTGSAEVWDESLEEHF